MRTRLSRAGLALLLSAAAIVLGGAARAGDADADAEGKDPVPSAPRRPAIVVILADDLGYADLGVQGGQDIPTPNLDALAKAGVRFTNGYVTCPFCAPTRAGLLTGRYPQRFGFETNPGPEERASAAFGLPLDVPTLAERLQAAGYATGMVGKWHLGYAEGRRPSERGFDEFFGFLGGGHSYLGGRRGASQVLRGLTEVAEKEYLTRAFGREAASFVERHADEPFFLYLAFNAVHAPLEADPDPAVAARVRSIADPTRRTYASMLVAMDDAVGRVLATLEKRGLARDTLVFFLSDNGGPTPTTTASNDPLRGRKGQVYEGGVRVPFFVRWPAKLEPGAVEERVVTSLDVVPTVLRAAGVEIVPGMKLEGRDLLPWLASGVKAGAKGAEVAEAVVCWRLGDKRAVRKGDWKLILLADGGAELYDLAADVGELKDLAAERPEKVKELRAAWEAWDAANVAPLWRWRGRR